MAVGEGVATPQSLLWRRLREKLLQWRRLFVLNWNLFKASRIGVVGLAIMIAFVLLALAAPFMGLRDPIRWTAPDEDLIDVAQYWEVNSAQGGSELATAPPITQGVAFRINPPVEIEPRSDRVYIPAGDRLYAFLTEAGDVRRNAWGLGQHLNITRIDGTPRAISVPPLVMNYGFHYQAPPDFEMYLGTDDGRVVILRDAGFRVPAPEPFVNLSGRVTGMAAFTHDADGAEFVIGRANYVTYDGLGTDWAYQEIPGAVRGDEGEFASLALRMNGSIAEPLLAYYDVTKGIPKVSARMENRWEFLANQGEGVEPFTANSQMNLGFFTSLAVGSDGLPRVAYQDQTDTALKFAWWNGTAWNTTYLDNDGDVGKYVSLALDGLDRVHIAYYDASGNLKYISGDGITWGQPEFADVSPGFDVGQYASLALNASGSPHIAYYNAAGGLKHAWKAGPIWQNETIVGGNVGQYASIAFDPTDPSDVPAIAYYQGDGSLGFVRQLSQLGPWGPAEMVDPGPNDVGRHASLAFSPTTGERAIAYQDATNFDLKFANDTGSGWRLTTIRSEWHTGFNNSLRFDANGRPHIGFYTYRTGRSTEDILVVGTETGNVYGIEVSIPDSLQRLDRAKVVSRWDYRIRWNTSVGSEVHLAAGPMTKIGAYAAYSPAFGDTGAAVFLGTQDGLLLSLNTTDGGNFWWNAPQSHFWMGSPWHTAPIVRFASEGPPKDSELLYATTSHVNWDFWNGNNSDPESLLVVRYADDARPLSQWLQEFPGYNGSAFIGKTNITTDGGDLTQPVVDGDNIYFGSSKGRLYAVRRDGRGEYPTWNLAPASVRWIYEDPTLLGLDPQFRAAPFFVSDSLVLLAVANHNNGTAADPSDDRGVLYSIRGDQGNVSWKRSMPSTISGMPQSWKQTSSPGAIHPSVWVTYGGAGRINGVIALSTVGLFLAPSEPSWAHDYDCGDSDNPSRRCPGYPSGNQYWLGLDSQGRDIFSQVIWGSRIALLVGFLSAFFTVLLGVIVGLIAGYVGGKTESILMRFTDVILVLPGLPLIITLAAVLGASIWNIILVISLLGWPGVARIIRAEVLSLKERPFIDSARVTGASTTRIVFRHIAPNVMPLAFLYMTFSVSGAILTEAALSFIGLGDIATMSWGIMLQLVSQSEALKAWWWLLPPGLAITLISLAFFLVGRAFDEIVNPRLRKR